MQEIVLNWMGPLQIRKPVLFDLRGWPGLYLIVCDSKIVYVGKAESEGALKRAKDHFRGQGDSTGRWILERGDERSIGICVAKQDWNEWISAAEELLIYRLSPAANLNCIRKYKGKPLKVINVGFPPATLPSEISHP
jgi:hypothetical protein